MYAFVPDQLRAIADLVETLNEGNLKHDLTIDTVRILDMHDGELVGTVEFDTHGGYGFIVSKKQAHDEV